MISEPANAAERLLNDAHRNADAMPRLLAEVARTALYVPAAGEMQGEDVPLPIWEHDDLRHVPAFTSDTQFLRVLGGEAPMIRVEGAALARMLPEGVMIGLNPGGELGMAIHPPDLTEGASHETIAAGTQVKVGDPAEEPGALLEEIAAAARELPGIARLHRALVIVGDREPQLAIGAEIDSEEPGPLLEQLAAAAGGTAFVLALEQGATDPIGAWMLRRDDPFFARG